MRLHPQTERRVRAATYPTLLTACAGIFFLCAAFVMPSTATAATKAKIYVPPYRAQVMNRTPDLLQSDVQGTVVMSVDILNTGTKTWKAKGNTLTALNAAKLVGTSLNVNKATKLYDKSWGTSVRPSGLTKDVKPGETAHVTFTLHAPSKAGEYRERFALATKGIDFINGSSFEVLYIAGSPKTLSYSIDPGLNSSATYTMAPGKDKTFTLTVTNTGTTTWQRTGTGQVVLAVVDVTKQSQFYNPLWISKTVIGRLTASQVKPGKQGTFKFAITAPKTYGEFTEQIQVLAPGLTRAVNGLIQLTIEVPSPSNVVDSSATLGAEPIVRVGMVTLTKGTAYFTAPAAYTIQDSAGVALASVAANGVATVTYATATGIYTVIANGVSVTTKNPVRLFGVDPATIMTVSSWKAPYNQFRGTLEVRFTPATGVTWVINELPMESYLAGMAETGNSGPTEFLKTMAVAARTYALFHDLRKTKHADENYDINATTDQVYLGYGYELKVPNLVAAAVATRGVVATHPAALSEKNIVGTIVAAYSSCTDGRTHSSKEVWNLDLVYFPYLSGVPDPVGTCTTPPYPSTYITGGGGNHMVGMSAFGALHYASDQGKTFDWILTYYYTGITLKKVYP